MNERRLFLDDIRPVPVDDSRGPWIICRSAEEAKGAFLAGPIDFATLDHDLGCCPTCNVTEDSDEGPRVVESYPCSHLITGYDLVKWMAENDVWPRQKPAVHSANPVGRAAMTQTIDRYWHAPGEPTPESL